MESYPGSDTSLTLASFPLHLFLRSLSVCAVFSLTVVVSSFLWKLICINTKVSLFKEKGAKNRRHLDMMNDIWQTMIHRRKCDLIGHAPARGPARAAPGPPAEGLVTAREGLTEADLHAFGHAGPSAWGPVPTTFLSTGNNAIDSSRPRPQLQHTVAELLRSPVHQTATSVLSRATSCGWLTGGPSLRG